MLYLQRILKNVKSRNLCPKVIPNANFKANISKMSNLYIKILEKVDDLAAMSSARIDVVTPFHQKLKMISTHKFVS